MFLLKSFAIVAILTFAWIVWYFYTFYQRKKQKSPPGPISVPYFGELFHFLLSRYTGNMMEPFWKETIPSYGPIVRMQFGQIPVILINDGELSKKLLSSNELMDRPAFMGHRTKETYEGKLAKKDRRHACHPPSTSVPFFYSAKASHATVKRSLASWQGSLFCSDSKEQVRALSHRGFHFRMFLFPVARSLSLSLPSIEPSQEAKKGFDKEQTTVDMYSIYRCPTRARVCNNATEHSKTKKKARAPSVFMSDIDAPSPRAQHNCRPLVFSIHLFANQQRGIGISHWKSPICTGDNDKLHP